MKSIIRLVFLSFNRACELRLLMLLKVVKNYYSIIHYNYSFCKYYCVHLLHGLFFGQEFIDLKEFKITML